MRDGFSLTFLCVFLIFNSVKMLFLYQISTMRLLFSSLLRPYYIRFGDNSATNIPHQWSDCLQLRLIAVSISFILSNILCALPSCETINIITKSMMSSYYALWTTEHSTHSQLCWYTINHFLLTDMTVYCQKWLHLSSAIACLYIIRRCYEFCH